MSYQKKLNKNTVEDFVKKNLERDVKHRPIIWMLYVIMTFVLAVLKLTGYINITWIWVFSPVWLPFTLVLSIFLGFLILTLSVGTIVIGSTMLWEKLTK